MDTRGYVQSNLRSLLGGEGRGQKISLSLYRFYIGFLKSANSVRNIKHSQVPTAKTSNLLADEKGPQYLGQVVVWIIQIYT